MLALALVARTHGIVFNKLHHPDYWAYVETPTGSFPFFMGVHNIIDVTQKESQLKSSVAIRTHADQGYQRVSCPDPDALNNFGDIVAFVILLAAGNYAQPHRVPY